MKRALAITSCVMFAVACHAILGIDNTRPDAGEDASVDAGPDIDPCTRTGVPDPSDKVGSNVEKDYIFALSKVNFGLVGTPLGFNLDKTCTCPSADSCKRPPDASSACDRGTGIDNAGLSLLQIVQTLKLVTEDDLNILLKSGVSGAVIRVGKYNGESNDNEVTVGIYPALQALGPVKLDGNDQWQIERASVTDEMTLAPKESANLAYVVNDTLVALFSTAQIVVGGADPDGGCYQPPLRMTLNAAIISAKITPDRNKLVQGVVTGRWRASDLFKSIEAFPESQQQPCTAFLCGASTSFGLLKRTVCNLVDISSTGQDDLKASCDAISGAIGFEATHAKISPMLGDRFDAGHPCGDDYKPSCSN